MSPKRKKYFNSKNTKAKLVQNIFEPIAHFHDIETSKTAHRESSSFSCCMYYKILAQKAYSLLYLQDLAFLLLSLLEHAFAVVQAPAAAASVATAASSTVALLW